MVAENEYGVRKFVCNTIRPAQLPYAELYELNEVGVFLSGYIHYEPLDPPTLPPTVLLSPTLTLKEHTADSFDLATLLCSFLIGAGYDAYVVHGYAPKSVTLMDQSNSDFPVSLSSNPSSSSSSSSNPSGKKDSGSDVNGGDADDAENPYQPPDNNVRRSTYLESEAERKRIEALDTFVLWNPKDRTKDVDGIADSDRVHAWVFVNAGRREVKESVFVEPTTGKVYPLNGSPYSGIEGLWNQKNFWVNLAASKPITALDFDLTSPEWEFLFIPTLGVGASEAKNAESGDADDENYLGDSDGAVPGTTSDGGPGAKSSGAASGQEIPFDPPPTWVSALTFDRHSFNLRYPPHGKRTVQFYKAKLDYFAKNTQSQGMVLRVTLYHDPSKIIVKEIHEWFENRKDKMFKRERYFLGERRFVEHFHSGSVGEVKQWLEYPGKMREIDFYINGRLDRMFRREEVVGQRVSEYFEGRTDLLTFRSVLLTDDRGQTGQRIFALPGSGLAAELYVTKMVTVFDRDSSAPAGSDVAKRTFYISEGRLVSAYHFVPGKMTCQVKQLNHSRVSGGGTSAANSSSSAANGGDEDENGDMEALQEAAFLEREVYTNVKVSFQHMQTVLKYRAENESKIEIEPTVFEIALERAAKDRTDSNVVSSDASDGSELRGADYLTPYLRHLRDPNRISREEAMDIRQTCLDALKARLVERANIIQARLSEENTRLARKQEHFQRSQRDGELSSEEYEKYCADAMFRIHILEQRLVMHEESALKKFAELDTRLTNDPRLKSALRS